jgi:AraC family transcriptional regulator of adaptative response/methylated-DNA-[protein]-cysteine methyltransferase
MPCSPGSGRVSGVVRSNPPGRLRDGSSPVLDALDRDPTRRWRERDLRELGVDPGRVRRWFQRQHGMTFQAYGRARRLGTALGQIRLGDDIDGVAYDHGYQSLSGFREAFGQLVGVTLGRARGTRPIALTRVLTPLGPMVAAAVDEGVCLLEFAERRMLAIQLRRLVRFVGGVVTPGPHPHLEQLDRELKEYFAGSRTAFGVPLHAPGTAFQEACWSYLRDIPYGQTRTYAEGAAAVDRPEAVRALGRANGDNRLAILVPCHRVVGADGRLTGYGGGLWRKRALLDLEAAAA